MEKVSWFLLILGLFLLVVEAFTVTFFLLPIGVGLVVASLIGFAYPSYVFMGLGFVAGFFLTFLLSYRITRKARGTKDVLSDLIGQEGIVLKAIGEDTYLVRFPLGAGGEEVWNAHAEEKLEYGDRVRVKGMVGNKVIVEKVEDSR